MVQGRSTSPMFVPLEISSAVLVMISSNRFTLDEPIVVK